MPDNLTIPDHARTMFANTWRDAMQQRESRLRDRVNLQTGCSGDTVTIDIDGIAEGDNVTGDRFRQIQVNEIATTQRYIYPQEYQLATHESRWDANSIAPLVSPTGKADRSHRPAFARFVDRLLLTQILGDASERAAGSNTPTTVALPAAQKIAKDYVDSGSAADSNLTVSKLIRALQLLEEAEVIGQDQMEAGAQVFCAVNSKASKALLREVNGALGAKLMSKDYMPPTLDKNGFISEFLGIQFIRTELVSTVSGVAYLPVWVNKCVDMAIWGDYQVTIDRLPGLSNALQFLSQARVGVTRTFDKGVVQIAAAQS